MIDALCHIFVFVPTGQIPDCGLTESFRRAHPGQGTANACFCFDNAYLEVLWVEDWNDVRSPPIAATRLAERADWRQGGASPFGIALRTDLPFPAWPYRPPYLPPGMAIPVATDSEDPRQPFLFRSPGSTRPDQWTDGRAGNRQAPAGLSEIVNLRLTMPDTPGPALMALAERGLLSVHRGAHRLDITLSGNGGDRVLSLPDFRWG
ncbi:MAG TPA: VOC family protein [Candidatus Omnitrophota bacterium]|nr:VOC family protein [Candidatus Omnitrophota bacterium]